MPSINTVDTRIRPVHFHYMAVMVGLGRAPAHFIYIDIYKSLHTVKNENKFHENFAHYENRKEFKYISNDGLFHSKKKML